jgi:hypothetical protein
MSKKPRARTERREREREQAKLVRERDRLARLLPGGSPERPIQVSSASVIEVQAKSIPCPLCGGELRIESAGAIIASPIGAAGEIFFENVTPGTYEATVVSDRGECAFQFRIAATGDDTIDLGRLVCREVTP